METKALVICVSLGSLGLISAILGFAAEARKVKILELSFQRNNYGYTYQYTKPYCSPNKIEATVLANASALLLLVAQIMVNAVTGCFCCNKHPNITSGNRCVALFCYIFSWVTFLVGFILLVMGACVNSNFYSDGCSAVKNGIFAAGGSFSLATVALGILYIKLSSPSETSGGASDSQKNQGIVMGQPPPQFLQHSMP